jgi:UDP-glucose 4-epimerase
MKILVTGGAGYIGTELVEQLVQDPEVEAVIVYDNLTRKNYNLFLFHELPGEKVRFIEGDLLDSRRLRQVLASIDTVIHLAARVTTPFAAQDPHYFEQVNHWGTAELVYAVEESPVQQFVYISSGSVYGFSESIRDEGSIPAPKTYYGVSKRRGEEHVERLQSKVKTQIIRLGNVYGFSPSMRFDAVINRFMLEANINNRISINGTGKQRRPFIHVDRAVEALHQVISKPVPSGTYNLVERNLSVLDIVETLQALYPGLETLHVNQHLDLMELQIEPQGALHKHINVPSVPIEEELQAFKSHFGLQPRAAKL